jgi:L-fucose isomerase-like protein
LPGVAYSFREVDDPARFGLWNQFYLEGKAVSAKKSTFALFFGNRGFFPASLMADARKELPEVLKEMGHDSILTPADATRHGAVETRREGEIFANFLNANRGKFDGVILSLPNFGDETGAISALKDAGVPIFIQAYPDDLDKMAPALRRDSFCGKFSIMDVFCQYGLRFTVAKPHTAHPKSAAFRSNVDYFDRVCRVVGGMKNMVIGSIGARTTAFKTVRTDEIALQRHGITMETFDLSSIFARISKVHASEAVYKDKSDKLRSLTSWEGAPEEVFDKIVRMGVVLDALVDEYKMDALALRCWVEMQEQLGISPCLLLGDLNDRGVAAACEVDVSSAIAMRALGLASGNPTACLDWNNNYGDDEDKCVLFHCGPVPPSMMTAKGLITDHAILANAVGEGCAYGCNVGRIAPTDVTVSNMVTEGGKLKFYLGEGSFTSDPIPSDFFGCAGVLQLERLQDFLMQIGLAGHRHHVGVTPGSVIEPIQEAFTRYLGYEVTVPQRLR